MTSCERRSMFARQLFIVLAVRSSSANVLVFRASICFSRAIGINKDCLAMDGLVYH